MDIYTIDNQYIDFLRTYDSRILDPKNDVSLTGGRKYIGTIITKNNNDYFVPLRSPKLNDDFVINGDGSKTYRSSSRVCIRIMNNGIMINTLGINTMIPVPKTSRTYFNIATETSPQLLSRMYETYRWLSNIDNATYVINKANRHYDFYKNYEANPNANWERADTNVFNNSVNFTELERACSIYIKQNQREGLWNTKLLPFINNKNDKALILGESFSLKDDPSDLNDNFSILDIRKNTKGGLDMLLKNEALNTNIMAVGLTFRNREFFFEESKITKDLSFTKQFVNE